MPRRAGAPHLRVRAALEMPRVTVPHGRGGVAAGLAPRWVTGAVRMSPRRIPRDTHQASACCSATGIIQGRKFNGNAGTVVEHCLTPTESITSLNLMRRIGF